MFCEPKYNPDKDLSPVIPGLAPDIVNIMETGVVEDLGLALSFNEIDDNGNIVGRVTDVFEALEYTKQKAIAANLKANAAMQQPGQPAPAGEGA